MLLKAVLLAAAVALPVEILSYAAGSYLAGISLLYDPPPFDYAAYLKSRDPVLGWNGPVRAGHAERDASGSRHMPNFPDPAIPSCVALFGDSFTWGDEVTADQAYGNVLSGLLRCRVANYGVPGYGTDQAYLRFATQIKNPAPIVILGYFSENIVRNISQDWGFRTNLAGGLKPRFVMEEGRLRLIPLPELSEADYQGLRSHAQKLLPYDYFTPGGPSGIHSLLFPYTLSVLGLVRDYRIRAVLSRRPAYAEFYDPRHPSHAAPVTEAIIKAFVEEARRRGQKPLVLLIPDSKDMRLLRNRQPLPYANLARRLADAGVMLADFAPDLDRRLGDRTACEVYTRCNSGHLNPEGQKMMAEFVYHQLTELGWAGAR